MLVSPDVSLGWVMTASLRTVVRIEAIKHPGRIFVFPFSSHCMILPRVRVRVMGATRCEGQAPLPPRLSPARLFFVRHLATTVVAQALRVYFVSDLMKARRNFSLDRNRKERLA